MAEMIIQNPSITTNAFEYDEVGRVSAIAGHPLAGEGGGTIVKSDLMWKPNVGSDGYVRWTLASSATSPEAAYISGAQGPAGPQGVSGNPGKNPEFRINSTDAHWQWKYSGDAGWTDLGVIASGAVGPQGLSGNNGKDGISPTVTTATIEGGNRVTFTYGEGSSTYIDVMSGASGANGINGISPTVSTETITGGNRVTFTYDDGGTTKTKSIDVMSGVSGAKGSDGFSPAVELTPIQDSQYPQGGWNVTITDEDHQSGQTFQIFNGINGQGATVDLIGGTGIQVSHQAGTTDYTISVSADYALKSELPDVTDMATKTWVGGQGYLTSIPNTYALKTDVEAASANAYDKAVAQIPDVTNFITKDVNNLTYYYKKTETSAANELATEFAKYVSTGDILTGTGDTLAGIKIGSTSYTVPTTDLSNYYTKSETSATGELNTEFAKKLDKTTYATDSATFVTSSNSTITGTKQYALTTAGWAEVSTPTIPNITANNGLSANGHTVGISTTNIDANKQYAWTTTGWQLVSVPTIPDITANNGLTANGHTIGIDNTNLVANTQYAWTTAGWAGVETAYLPLIGGTVTGQLEVHGGSNFDTQFIKLTREGNQCGARIGLGNDTNNGTLALKTFNAQEQNTVQVNVKYNTNNNELVQVQKGGSDVGFLIPAQIHQGSYTPSENDGILHIILES